MGSYELAPLKELPVLPMQLLLPKTPWGPNNDITKNLPCTRLKLQSNTACEASFSCIIKFYLPNLRLFLIISFATSGMGGSRGGGGGQGSDTPWKITKIGFLSNTGPDRLKNHKATKPAFNDVSSSARQRNAI